MDPLSLVLLLIPAAMMIIGIGMFWFASRAAFDRANGNTTWTTVVGGAGVVLALVGVLIQVAIMTHLFFFIGWIAIAVVILTAVYRFYDGERQSLLWILMTAAERGVPLDTAARAFADDHDGRMASQSQKLADYLEAGLPLGLALERSGFGGSTPALLAADMGQRMGTLGHALRQAVEQDDKVGVALRSVAHWLFYLAFLGLFMLVVITFLVIKIFPVMNRIFYEFDLTLPPVARWVYEATDSVMGVWILFLPLFVVGIASLVLGWINHLGFSLRRVPLVRRLWWRADCALVMHWIATGVRQQRPMVETLRLLAAYFPQPTMRTRLESAAVHIERGANWCDSLHRANVIRKTENVVFKAAERTGNLPWALDEMATSSMRRAAWRLRSWLDVLFPIVLLGFGVAVFFIILGAFQPLIKIIQSLA